MSPDRKANIFINPGFNPHKNLLQKLSEKISNVKDKIFSHKVIASAVLLILIVGLGVTLWLVQTQTNLFPKAFSPKSQDEIDLLTTQLLEVSKQFQGLSQTEMISKPAVPQTSFTLFPDKSTYTKDNEIVVKVLVRSDTDATNLFVAKIKYDQAVLRLDKIDTASTFVKNWVEQSQDTPGEISLVGGVPSPGIQTKLEEDAALMATLYFTALKEGNTTISLTGESAIYKNSDNTNTLSIKNNANIAIGAQGGYQAPSLPKDKLDKTIEIAQRRKELLLQKIKENPQEFLDKATLADKRDNFPEEVRGYIERKVQDQGNLSVIHVDDFENKRFEYQYYLKNKDDNPKLPSDYKYRVYFINPPQTTSGSNIQVNGVALDKTMAVSSFQIISQAVATPVTGDQKTLVMLIRLSDDTSAPSSTFTRDYVNNFMFGTAANFNEVTVNSYYKDNSFNKVSFLGDVVGEYIIEDNPYCEDISWAHFADLAAINAGVNLGNYKYRVYVFKNQPSSCALTNVAGKATVSGTQSWIFLRSTNVYLHEIGHNLGNMHANFLNCGQKTIDSPGNCQNIEYGDSTDVMGITTMTAPHFNGPHKIAMGWIPNIQTVTSNGTYTIAPLEVTTSLPQIIRISKPDTSEYYYVSYRQKTGYDSSFPDMLTRGANIHVWNENIYTQTKLLDINPFNPSDIKDASLSDEASFYDPINNIRIKQTSHTLSTGRTAGSVTLEISFSTVPQATSRRVFVTSQTFNGNLGSLTGADAKCQTAANNSSKYTDLKNSIWKVWLSDRISSAASRLNHSGKFILPNGTTIASDWTDLTDSILSSPINIDENGNTISNAQVWTHTRPNGTAVEQFGSACKDWTSSDSYPTDLGGFARTGGTNFLNSYWTDSGQGSDCNTYKALYCFEEPAPTPTPSPSPSPSPTPTPKPTYSFLEFVATFGSHKTLKDPERFNPKYDFNNDLGIDIVDYSGLVKRVSDGTIILEPLKSGFTTSGYLNTHNKKQGDSGFNAKYDADTNNTVNVEDYKLIMTDSSSSSTPTLSKGNGDGNKDGKIDLADLSVLLTDFDKGNFRVEIDLNGDGKINTFDFSLLKNLLIEKKVIKG